MSKLVRGAIEFLVNEDGPTAVEYAVMLALIIVVCVTAITTLGSNANNTFSYVDNQIGGNGSYYLGMKESQVGQAFQPDATTASGWKA